MLNNISCADDDIYAVWLVYTGRSNVLGLVMMADRKIKIMSKRKKRKQQKNKEKRKARLKSRYTSPL